MQHGPAVRVVPGFDRPALLWELAMPRRCVATAVVGGGIGNRGWIANVNVPLGYDHPDPSQHATELAAALGCSGPGCCLLTGVDVRGVTVGEDAGVEAFATVGPDSVGWAADEGATWTEWRPDTINCIVFVPARLTEAALVNLVMTASEAKAQALFECRIPGTGTPSDAIVVCTESGHVTEASQWYGGPRSYWGARVARAVHRAVVDGVRAHTR
jgi:adenosylcobinamide amidohydrolase